MSIEKNKVEKEFQLRTIANEMSVETKNVERWREKSLQWTEKIIHSPLRSRKEPESQLFI